jgi:hypothetical protein
LLLREGLRRMAATDRGELAADILKRASVANGRLMVTYVWSRQIEERVRAALLSPEDQERLHAYHGRLVETVAGAPNRVSLAALMQPLFQTVLERGAGGDVAAESRAAIVVLAFYANGTGLAAIAPAAAQWPQAARRTVTLARRDDFPKHFLISAAIAAEAGSPLADASAWGGRRLRGGRLVQRHAADRAGTSAKSRASRPSRRASSRGLPPASMVTSCPIPPVEFLPRRNSSGVMAASAGPGTTGCWR